jgi:hypothetical protein
MTRSVWCLGWLSFAMVWGAVGCTSPKVAAGVTIFNNQPTSADSGGDAQSGYQPWQYPDCTKSDGSCMSSCMPAQLQVAKSACGQSAKIDAGCVPKNLAGGGWGCWVRVSDDEVIITLDVPNTSAGLETCYSAGLTSSPESLPSCPDGGGS